MRTIIQEREKSGRYKSLDDFSERAKNGILSKSLIENLIRVGAFDTMGHTRATLIDAIPRAVERAQKIQKDKSVGQDSLFGDIFEEDTNVEDSIREELPELDSKELLIDEKKLLGIWISGHPLMEYSAELALFVTDHSADLFEKKELGKVRMAGIVSDLKKKKIKSGDRMGLFNLEDQTGSVEVAIMPDLLTERESIIVEEEIMVVEGVAQQRGDSISVRADLIMTLSEAWTKFIREVHLNLKSGQLDNDQILRLKSTLLQHNGNTRVVLHVKFPEIGIMDYEIESSYFVTPSHDLKKRMVDLFDENAVSLKAVTAFSTPPKKVWNNNKYPSKPKASV